MKNINDFYLDRDLSPEEQNKILIKYIDEFYNSKSFYQQIIYLSQTFDIPINIFEQDVKNYLVTNFKNSCGKFFPYFNFYSSLKSIFKNLALYIWILFFEDKKIKKQSFYEIILDDISHVDEAFRYNHFLKLFKNYLIVSRVNLPDKKNFILFDNYKNLTLKKSLKKKKIKIFYYIIKLFFLSLKNRTNYQDIIFFLIRFIIKYESIFSNHCSYYLTQERQFTTSSLKNFLFKKNGGFKTFIFQRNIAQLNGPGMYTCADFFFSMGNKSHLQYLKCKSKFEQIYPVGSFFMNIVKFKKLTKSNIPKYDLLHIASNMNYFQDTHSKFLDDWIEQFSWLATLNKKNPGLKICIKGRKYDGLRKNKKFMDILKNSTIIFIDEHYEDQNNKKFKYDSSHSYDYASNAKIICTWQSTMGFEMMSLNKPSIFLDPYSRNTAHLPNEKHYNDVKVTSYNDFENFVFKNLDKKDYKSHLNTDEYCLDSSNTIEKTFEILMENLKIKKNR